MKVERSRKLQVERIERQKSNAIAIVKNLPEGGVEGDEIYRGIPPVQVDRGDGFYKRLNDKWVFISGFQASGEPTFSTEIGPTP